MTRVLAFAKYGPAAASTRQRLLQFLPALRAAGIEVEVQTLLDDDYVRSLANRVNYPKANLISAYSQRLWKFRSAREFDLLWVYGELFPGLPAPFEQLGAAIGRPLIYDCDDAFFHNHERSPLLRGKLRRLVQSAAVVTAGNTYLADFLGCWSNRVRVVPTVVDTDIYQPRRYANKTPVIGWIGSPSTWEFVKPYLPLLASLCSERKARFLAVGAGTSAERDLFPGMELRNWAERREVADVQSMDIGIMPLPDEPWARGKCGYKLIQYMACGLPTLASPVGVNREIVANGKTGYLVGDDCEWNRTLLHLLSSAADRDKLGTAGRDRVVASYSLQRWAPEMVDMFRALSTR